LWQGTPWILPWISHRARSMPLIAVPRMIPVAVPEMLAIHHLPEVLDPRGILAENELGHVLDRPYHRPGVPLERRLAPPVQAGLIRQHLHENPVPHPGVTDVCFDSGDFHHGPPL